MGRKGKWFSSVKKAFSPDSNKKKSQKVKSTTFVNEESVVQDPSPITPNPIPQPEELDITEIEDKEISVEESEAVVATEDEAVFESLPEEVTISVVDPFEGKSKDDVAAIKIQRAFRGYQSRKSLRSMRGLVRLKSLVQAPPVKRQTTTALRCMQTLARVQAQIQSRRIRMSEENQALQRQLLQIRAKELASSRVGEDWDDSPQSKEDLEASLLSKYEATMRREKAMAYSFTHQQTWKKSQKPTTLMFMDPNNPQWGWSWVERWVESRPWDTKTNTEKENQNGNDTSSLKSTTLPTGGEITKAYAHHLLNPDKPSTLRSRTTPSKKLKLKSPKKPISDPESPLSVQSDKSNRRHTIGGESEGSGSPRSVPSYMASTKSVKARLKQQSPLGLDNGPQEKDVAGPGPIKKRLSFSASPARPLPRRNSGPPKVDLGPVMDQNAINGVTNGE